LPDTNPGLTGGPACTWSAGCWSGWRKD